MVFVHVPGQRAAPRTLPTPTPQATRRWSQKPAVCLRDIGAVRMSMTPFQQIFTPTHRSKISRRRVSVVQNATNNIGRAARRAGGVGGGGGGGGGRRGSFQSQPVSYAEVGDARAK